MTDTGRTIYGGSGGGGAGLFSMVARYWFSTPFSAAPDVGSALDRGPAFDWSLSQYQDGSYSSDLSQHQVLEFGEAGIFSVTLACNVSTPTADPLTDRAVNVAILAGEELGPYIQTNWNGMVEVAGGATAPSVSATFAAAEGDMHHLLVSSNDGGCLTATTYLTVVKLAPYA